MMKIMTEQRGWLPRVAIAMTLALISNARTSALAQASGAAQDPRPIVAVLPFTGGALVHPTDYSAFGRGLRELLTVALASHAAVQVIERERLQAILDEQHAFHGSPEIDPATAVQIGHVLGANHIVTGSFLIDANGRVRIDVKSINVETSELEYRQVTEGKTAKLFDVFESVEHDLVAGLHLPPSRSAAVGMSGGGKGDQARAIQLLGRAIDALSRHDTTAARSAARDALATVTSFPAAQALLASLEPRLPIRERR